MSIFIIGDVHGNYKSLTSSLEKSGCDVNADTIIFVLTDGDNNTGYEFSDTKNIIAGMDIPIYTISYNYAADSLSELASINEAAAIVGNSEDITYKLRNLFNAEM